MTGIVLRDYQTEAIERTLAAEKRGIRAQMGVAATGLGKTVMFTSLIRRRGGRALILAHRDELVSQAVAHVRQVWPTVDVGVVKAERDEVAAHVVVASVQTLARGHRIDRLLTPGSLFGNDAPFDIVVVDEAHHSAADTYRTIIDRLNAGQSDGPLLLGVTATPDRGDGKGLDDVFDEVVWSYDLLWGIRAGFLSDVRGLRVTIPKLDLSTVKVSRGDYQAGAAGAAMIAADAPSEIVEAWRRHAADRRTLVFCPTVAAAEAVEAEYRSAGVAVSMVDGTLDRDIRRQRLADYAAGDIQVMVNCMVLTEGYDSPRTDCIVVARPTKSRSLYTQMVGRGTRRHPEKQDLLVLDCVGVTDTLSLVTIPSLFGVPAGFDRSGALGDGTGTATGILDEYDQLQVRLGNMRVEQAEMFKKIRGEGIAWVPVMHPGWDTHRLFVCSLGDGDMARISADTDGWTAMITQKNEPDRPLIVSTSLETAQGVAEDYIRKNGARGLTAANAGWRSVEPSPKQTAFARRLGIDWQGMTKGELSDAITARVEARKVKA